MRNLKTRILSFIVACLVVCQAFVVLPLTAGAHTEGTSHSWTSLGGFHLSHEQHLHENGDGSFTLTVDIGTDHTRQDVSTHSDVASVGYFTTTVAGWYLIELWGGNGAGGSDSNYSKGGVGGAGGYLYGKIYLEKGETLYYTLGGNGVPTSATDDGGGANGTGGGHGGTGSTTIGGGGGYSALFKFAPGEFEAYLDAYGNLLGNISESDRVSHYIMIAGGGGGGGAGNGNSSTSRTPDGGAGGGYSSASGKLSGSGYDVEGTFFAGGNGKSSGTNTTYIGRGGTNTPGATPESILDLFEGQSPNDWRGTYNDNSGGGAGGSGNLRGGAGGAGFCGGSGGVQTGTLFPNNVGGGGGGSSFVASSVTYENLSNTELSYRSLSNPSDHGGAITITMLEGENSSFLNNLDFSIEASKYFTIESASALTNGVANGTLTLTGGKTLSVKGVALPPSSHGTNDGEHVLITMTLRPVEGFAGGNNVPLFAEGNSILCTASDGKDAKLHLGSACGYVNVALSFGITVYSHATNTPGTSYAVSSLFVDEYAGIRTTIRANYLYDFIDILTPYTVKTAAGVDVTGGTVAPEKTANYTVSYTVTPKNLNDVATVGAPNRRTTISARATITVINPSSAYIGSNELSYAKSLVYENGKYLYKLHVTSMTEEIRVNPGKDDVTGLNQSYNSSLGNENTFTVTADGYYYLEVYGGNGGKGGDFEGASYIIIISYPKGTGGAGGSGGYAGGYFHLSKGDTLTYHIGANGANGTNYQERDDALLTSSAGKGGDYSYILLNGAPLLIAGGGGGGSAAGSALWNQVNGNPGASVSNTDEDAFGGSYAPYKGGDAANGVKSGTSYAAGAAGSAGHTFHSELMLTDAEVAALGLTVTPGSFTNAGGGGAFVTCARTDGGADSISGSLIEAYSHYALNAAISRYFAVEMITGINADGSALSFFSSIDNTNPASKLITLENILPAVTFVSTDNSDGTKNIRATMDFTINIVLHPEQGFLGGNDVPLFASPTILTQADESATLEGADATDYANVAVTFDTSVVDFDIHTATYQSGSAIGVNLGDLYTLNCDPDNFLTGYEPWQVEFVTPLLPENQTVTPLETTSYAIRVGVGPKAEATKAITVATVEGAYVEKSATVYVDHQVIYHLTNLTAEGTTTAEGLYMAPHKVDYVATLAAAFGYVLPTNIRVMRGNTTLTPDVDYTYNSHSGELVIFAHAVTSDLSVTASGEVRTHILHYIWSTTPDGSQQQEHTEVYRSGQAITPYNPYIPTYTGYTFHWDWGDGSTTPFTTMPAEDWWVTGTYSPNPYTLTIHYVDEAGNTLAPDSVSTVTYNSQYSVVSPIIDGYMANQATVSGLMKNDLTVTVTYTATHNTLNILYILADGNVEYSRYTGTFATGATYSIPSPEIDGYSPDMAVVSGTMSASGATVYVYYHHNTYTVTFDAAGGECTTDAMTVMYHHMYGHDGALPSAVRVGYRFDGWYLGNTRITEESYVNIASDHTLTARWIAYTFTITIHYTYADGTEALPDQMHTLAYGEQYRFDAAPIAGYTASPPTISGTMSAQNAVTTIVYTPNDYTLTIFYVYAGDGIHQQGETAAPTYQASVKHGQTVVVSSPIIAGYHAQETVSLTVNAADAVFTIYYYLNAPIIAVTVEWGSMTFDFTGGEWNPDKHAFEGQTIQPSTTDCNKITVTNDASNIAVHMDLSYHAESAYANLSAYFTKTASPSDVAHAGFQDEILAVGESFDTWIWITGIFDVLPDGEFVSGRCTVTIRGGT